MEWSLIMEPGIQYSLEDAARVEIRQFVLEGLQDLQEGKLLDFNSVFDELEKRYNTSG